MHTRRYGQALRRRLLLLLTSAAVLPHQAALAGPSQVPAPAVPRDAQRLVLASMFDRQDTGAGLLLSMIYTEAFHQMGVELEIRSFPPARARAEAVAGNVDGELARAYAYEALQRTMMRVPEPGLIATTAAYVRDPHIRLDGWESLRGTTLRVEFRAGYAVIEQRLAALVPADHLSSVTNGEQGLKKLALGRTDVYVDNEEFVEPVLAGGMPEAASIYKAGVLDSEPVYAYLNKRHAGLARRLAEVLRKMKADGQLDRIRAMVREKDKLVPR
jgi:ABC-type amino acid transport substrate-binding protein